MAKGDRMKSILTLGLLTGIIATSYNAHAEPDLMQPVGTAGLPLKVYRDHDRNSNVYWYIPTSVEPWTLDDQYKSVLSKTPTALTFIFRGQQSASEEMLKKIAKANNTSINNFTPISYEYSKDLVCQNVYASDPNVTWLFPHAIGNYLEIVPVSLRVVNDQSLINEIDYILRNGGLACTVAVGFKAYTMAYHAHFTFNLNQVYSRFEAAAHGELGWFEVDIHTTLQEMKQQGFFKFHLDEDTSIEQTVLDQKMTSAFEDLEKRIITLIFEAAPRIPNGSLPDRGKPFSLRVDYVRSEFNANFELDLSSDKVKVKDSQIGLRIGVK